MGMSLPKDDGVTSWGLPKTETLYWEYFPDGPIMLFHHPWYVDCGCYPDRAADLASYWAESRILGGVALLDRRALDADVGDTSCSAGAVNLDAIYLHPGREEVIYRIFRPLEQRNVLFLDFLLAEDPPVGIGSTPGSLLPIMIDEKYWRRVDPEKPIPETGT